MSKVLVVTNLADPHSDAVISALYELGVEVVRFHPGDCNSDISITMQNGSNAVRIESSNRQFSSDEIMSVWFRRPDRVDNIGSDITQPDRHFVIQETRATLSGLYGRIDDAVWISHPYNVQRAAWKLFQLDIASRVGFHCPPYIVSNDQKLLADFASTHEQFVMKAIHELSTCFADEGQSYSLYVKKFTKEKVPSLFLKKPLTPVYLQKYIQKSMDVRVTMIGFKIFAVAIRDKGDAEVVDFRVGCLGHEHEMIKCPPNIERSIIAYAQEMGLNFGAFDFAVSRNGEWYFLECNPNGQWMWLEMLTGVPLVITFARHLALLDDCPVPRFRRDSSVGVH
jgi:glutathione synthase/RimK-type ligase-like ATP-grasp enzyme